MSARARVAERTRLRESGDVRVPCDDARERGVPVCMRVRRGSGEGVAVPPFTAARACAGGARLYIPARAA
jgi:hypothetical protein